MEFDYLRTIQSNAVINIEDIGNCALKAFNDVGMEYILIIETSLGNTRVFTFGPVIPDMETLPQSVSMSMTHMDYSQPKIAKTIRTFLNDVYHNITQVLEVDKEEALEECRDLISYVRDTPPNI